MTNLLIQKHYEDYAKTVRLLRSSLSQYQSYSSSEEYTDKELEVYDAFSFRFQKALETGITFYRHLDAFVNQNERKFVRDLLMAIEKIGLITSAHSWMEARGHRNKIAHAYDSNELERIYEQAFVFSQMIVQDFEHSEPFLKSL